MKNKDGKYSFTFDESLLVCKSFDSELATIDQMYETVKNGGSWDTKGWIKNQMALQPVKNASENDPIIDGHYYSNKLNTFGVNCYGIKPENFNALNPKPTNKLSEEEIKVTNLEKEIAPFNNKKWSLHK